MSISSHQVYCCKWWELDRYCNFLLLGELGCVQTVFIVSQHFAHGYIVVDSCALYVQWALLALVILCVSELLCLGRGFGILAPYFILFWFQIRVETRNIFTSGRRQSGCKSVHLVPRLIKHSLIKSRAERLQCFLQWLLFMLLVRCRHNFAVAYRALSITLLTNLRGC